jgi:hypothetical protein
MQGLPATAAVLVHRAPVGDPQGPNKTSISIHLTLIDSAIHCRLSQAAAAGWTGALSQHSAFNMHCHNTAQSGTVTRPSTFTVLVSPEVTPPPGWAISDFACVWTLAAGPADTARKYGQHHVSRLTVGDTAGWGPWCPCLRCPRRQMYFTVFILHLAVTTT